MNAAAAQKAPNPVEELQVEISVALRQLGDAAPLLAELADSYQRGLSFLTHDGRVTLDRLAREERRLRVENAQRGLPAPAAATPSPGNLAAISLQTEVTVALHHQIKRISRALAEDAGLCIIDRRQVPAEATVQELLTKLRHLAWNAPSRKLLTSVRDELENLADRTAVYVDNNRPGLFDEACPHCNQRTLVIYPGEDLIRCDRDPRTGRFHACVCPDWTCPCHQDPVAYRHEWRRPATFGHRSYAGGLARLIAYNNHRKEHHMDHQVIGVDTADREAATRLLNGYFTHLEAAGAVGGYTPTTDLAVDAMTAALASLAAADGEAQHHKVILTFESGDSPTVEFVCTAPEGAGCRMAPKCMVDGTCIESEYGHTSECPVDSKDRDKVDSGFCVVKSWIDVDPVIMGSGKLTLPVTTMWTGDDYLFLPVGAEEIS